MHTYTQVGCLRAFDNVVSDNNRPILVLVGSSDGLERDLIKVNVSYHRHLN